jgi:phosphoribosylamine--glycine ligase
MKVLVLGSGGREHAFVWRLARDPEVTEVIAAPGNPGMAAIGRCLPVDLTSPEAILALAEAENVDLTVVGPEIPLAHGVTDAFRRAGRAIVGPSRAGAGLECSKAYAKEFMQRAGIPTARFVVCDDLDAALTAVAGSSFGFPVVVKADGLAAGKGVVVATDRAEAEAAVRAAMVEGRFGGAGATLVIEECLSGPEVSLFVLSDGQRAVPLGGAQDHKRVWDDDLGPNTGGMGAFSPSPLVTPALEADTLASVVRPVIDRMREDGDPYRGFLYVSLMLTADGPKVIEFNVRFGDPEAQVIMPLIEGSFARALMGAATGSISDSGVAMGSDYVVGIVLASRGYPASAESGQVITGLDRAAAVPNAIVFHAGTRATPEGIVTAGGRVLTVVGRGGTYEAAMRTAYAAAAEIHFDGMHYRKDIGRKALGAQRLSSPIADLSTPD